jgi:hypothetical protein
MSTECNRNGYKIILDKKGADRYIKISYPQRYGRYSEVESADAVYQFNCNGEILFAKGKGRQWPDPQEWLKRSVGNDWIYYSTGGYTGVFEAIGEFYLPNLQYPTNALIGGKPFAADHVRRIINGWHEKVLEIRDGLAGAAPDITNFIDRVALNSPANLAEKARRFFQINGGRVTVLPPDSRHVDYNIIPLTIAAGCLYKCRFCKVKTSKPFEEVERTEIDRRLEELAEFYGENVKNYNSLFLGEHDALCCNPDLVIYSVARAYERLGFAGSYMRGANVFLFGSVGSFLAAEEQLFDELRRMPCEFYINIGLESADQETLDVLGKPVSATMVEEAFRRMQNINDRYSNIEVSANFLMDATLPKNHYPSFLRLVRDSLPRRKPKGTIYLSPLKFDAPSRDLVFDFNRLKLQSRLPTFLYIIQRL